MTKINLFGSVLFGSLFLMPLLGQSEIVKEYYPVGLIGLALLAIPNGYLLNFLKLVCWLWMVVAATGVGISEPLWMFVWFILHGVLAKLAGAEFDEGNNDFHDDHWLDDD